MRNKYLFLIYIIINVVIKGLKKISFFFKPAREIWLFGGWFGNRFADNSKYFFLYVAHREKSIRAVWITRDKKIRDELRLQGYESYLAGERTAFILGLRAKVNVIDQSIWDLNPWLSNGSINVQLWHGIGLKKVKNYIDIPKKTIKTWLSHIALPTGWRVNNYFLLSTSKYTTEILSKTFGCKVDMCLQCGYPRVDKIVKPDLFPCASKIELELKKMIEAYQSKGFRVVGYFPTFRDSGTYQFLGIKNSNEVTKLIACLERNKIILVTKEHSASMNELVNLLDYKNIINLDAKVDLYESLFMYDGVISDYSTIFLDYLYVDKPIIIYAFDYDFYKNSDRGFMPDFDFLSDVGPKVCNIDTLLKEIDRLDSIKENFTEKRQLVKKKMFDSKASLNSELLYKKVRQLIDGK